jgi:hypothetical protein
MAASTIFEAITPYDQTALRRAIDEESDSVNQKDEDGLRLSTQRPGIEIMKQWRLSSEREPRSTSSRAAT